MSVLVVVQVSGDTDQFRQSLTDRAADFEATAARAKQAGAIHHRFGIGEGVVVAVDEWQTAAQFEAFFSDPQMLQFIGEIGGDTSTAPQITVTAAVASPDQF